MFGNATREMAVKFTADEKDLDKGVDNLGGTVGRVGGKLKGFAIGGAALAAGAVAKFGVDSVMAGADLEESIDKAKMSFGDASRTIVDNANNMADAFGLPKQEMVDGATNIGLLGKAAGLAEGDAANMGTAMANLAADTSSFHNIPLPEALDKIRSGLAGEAEPLRSLGILMNEAAVKEKAYAMGIAERGSELTESQKVMARQQLITEGLSDASGNLEATQGSLANRVRELKGRFQNASAEIGQKLIPVVLKVWDWFDAKLPPAIEKVKAVFSSIGEVFQRVRDWISGFTSGSGGQISSWGKKLSNIFTGVREIVVIVWSKIQTVIRIALDIIQGFWDRFGKTFLGLVNRVWSRVKTVIDSAMNVIQGIIDVVLGVITGDWKRAWEGLKKIVTNIWRIIRTAIANAIDIVKTVIQGALNLIQSIWSRTWTSVKTKLSSIWDGIKQTVSRAVANVKERFNSLVSNVRGIPGRIRSAASGMFNGIKDAFKSAINWLVRKWNNISFTIGGGTFDPPGPGPAWTWPSFSLSTPNIPYLASGGIVNSPTLAMIGEGRASEAVLPLDKNTLAKYGLGSTIINVTGTMLDPEGVAREIERILHDSRMRTGAYA